MKFRMKPAVRLGSQPWEVPKDDGPEDTQSAKPVKNKARVIKSTSLNTGLVPLQTAVTAFPDFNEHGKPRGANSKAKVQLTDLEIDSAESTMALVTQEILDLLDSDDSDGAITLTQKHLLRTVLTMLPQAERIIRASKTSRGIFNFN